MKKLLLSLVLVLAVTISASAQYRPYPKPCPQPAPKYYYNPVGQLRLHVVGELGFLDLGGFFVHRMPRHYSVGAMAEFQAGRVFSLGLGAEFYGSRAMTYNQYNYYEYLNCVPVYGMVRLSTPNAHSRLFVEGKVGYAIPVNRVSTNIPGGVVAAQGFYTSAGLGVSFYGSNISIGFNSIDMRNQFVLLDGPSSSAGMFTDFYLRYSFALPMN